MAEQTLTLIAHNPSFTHFVYYINQIPGHRMQLSKESIIVTFCHIHVKAYVAKFDIDVKKVNVNPGS